MQQIKLRIAGRNVSIAVAATVAIIMTYLTNNPIYHISAMWGLAVVAIFLCKFKLEHPYFWFSSAFSLYSTAYAIMYCIDPQGMIAYSSDNIRLPIVALTAFLFSVGTQDYTHDLNKYASNLQSVAHRKILRRMLTVLIVLIGIAIFLLARNPFTHKNEMVNSRNIWFLWIVYASRYVTLFYCCYILLLNNAKTHSVLLTTIVCGISILTITLLTGERDAIFRFLLIAILVLYVIKKIDMKHLLLLLPLGVAGMLLATYYKYYFVRGTLATAYSLAGDHLLYNFLNTDFSAAGMNLQVLLNYDWTCPSGDYVLLLTDALSPFFPGSTFFNIATWFNETFYPNSYSRAFTLTGQGYVINGYMGVIVIFVLVGFIIRYLYHQSMRNVWWFATYIYCIPTTIMAFRSSLSTIFVALFRIVLVGMIALFFLRKIKIYRLKI